MPPKLSDAKPELELSIDDLALRKETIEHLVLLGVPRILLETTFPSTAEPPTGGWENFYANCLALTRTWITESGLTRTASDIRFLDQKWQLLILAGDWSRRNNEIKTSEIKLDSYKAGPGHYLAFVGNSQALFNPKDSTDCLYSNSQDIRGAAFSHYAAWGGHLDTFNKLRDTFPDTDPIAKQTAAGVLKTLVHYAMRSQKQTMVDGVLHHYPALATTMLQRFKVTPVTDETSGETSQQTLITDMYGFDACALEAGAPELSDYLKKKSGGFSIPIEENKLAILAGSTGSSFAAMNLLAKIGNRQAEEQTEKLKQQYKDEQHGDKSVEDFEAYFTQHEEEFEAYLQAQSQKQIAELDATATAASTELEDASETDLPDRDKTAKPDDDINASEKLTATALLYGACYANQVELLTVLLKKFPSLFDADFSGLTADGISVINASLTIVLAEVGNLAGLQYVLENDPAFRNSTVPFDLLTQALQRAIINGHMSTAAFLLSDYLNEETHHQATVQFIYHTTHEGKTLYELAKGEALTAAHVFFTAEVNRIAKKMIADAVEPQEDARVSSEELEFFKKFNRKFICIINPEPAHLRKLARICSQDNYPALHAFVREKLHAQLRAQQLDTAGNPLPPQVDADRKEWIAKIVALGVEPKLIEQVYPDGKYPPDGWATLYERCLKITRLSASEMFVHSARQITQAWQLQTLGGDCDKMSEQERLELFTESPADNHGAQPQHYLAFADKQKLLFKTDSEEGTAKLLSAETHDNLGAGFFLYAILGGALNSAQVIHKQCPSSPIECRTEKKNEYRYHQTASHFAVRSSSVEMVKWARLTFPELWNKPATMAAWSSYNYEPEALPFAVADLSLETGSRALYDYLIAEGINFQLHRYSEITWAAYLVGRTGSKKAIESFIKINCQNRLLYMATQALIFGACCSPLTEGLNYLLETYSQNNAPGKYQFFSIFIERNNSYFYFRYIPLLAPRDTLLNTIAVLGNSHALLFLLNKYPALVESALTVATQRSGTSVEVSNSADNVLHYAFAHKKLQILGDLLTHYPEETRRLLCQEGAYDFAEMPFNLLRDDTDKIKFKELLQKEIDDAALAIIKGYATDGQRLLIKHYAKHFICKIDFADPNIIVESERAGLLGRVAKTHPECKKFILAKLTEDFKGEGLNPAGAKLEEKKNRSFKLFRKKAAKPETVGANINDNLDAAAGAGGDDLFSLDNDGLDQDVETKQEEKKTTPVANMK